MPNDDEDRSIGELWMLNKLTEIEDQERFGLKVDQDVEIIAEGPFYGQQTKIRAFTESAVIVPVSGPAGELDSERWFLPGEVKPLTDSFSA